MTVRPVRLLLLRPCSSPSSRRPLRSDARLADTSWAGSSSMGCRCSTPPPASTAARRARLAVAAGEQHELGGLGAEHVARVTEDVGRRPLDVGGPLQDLCRLVEELETAATLALAEVGPIGGEDDGDRHREQPHALGTVPHQGDGEEGEAGVGHRADGGQGEHLGGAGAVEAALGDGDHGLHGDDPRQGARSRRRQRRAPGDGADTTAGGDGVEHQEGDGAGQGELAQVEGQLLRTLAAHDGEGDAGPHEGGDQQVCRREEEEADDERHLAQREAVGVTPPVDVDDVGLGQGEEGGHGPPGPVGARRPWGDGAPAPPRGRGRRRRWR